MLNFIIFICTMQLFIDLTNKTFIIIGMITQNEILSEIQNDIISLRGFL